MPGVSQTYEFLLTEDLPHGVYPLSLRLFGYQKFDGVFVAVPNPEVVTEAGSPVASKQAIEATSTRRSSDVRRD